MKLTKILIIGASLALALACGVAAQLDSKLETAQVVISQHESTIANQKLVVNGLASEITFLSGEVSQLAEHAEMVAMLNAEHERQTQLITDTGNDWLVNSNKLQVSDHEPTRTWAAMPLPDDALRMLSEASRSQNGDSKGASLYPASFQHRGLILSATSI